MNRRAVGRWVRIFVDSMMLYALYHLGVEAWILIILGVSIAIAGWLEFKTRINEEI
jgi:hypothetical protein